MHSADEMPPTPSPADCDSFPFADVKRQPDRQLVLSSPWPGLYGTWISSDRRYPRHWHDTYGFGMIEAGAQRSASGRGVVEAVAGNVITTNPGEVHDGCPLGSTPRRWRMVYLEPAFMQEWAEGLGLHPFGALELTRPVIDDPVLVRALSRLLERLHTWQQEPDPTGVERLACEEALSQACWRLIAHHATPSRRHLIDGNVARARDRLAAAELPAPSLAELAAEAGMSRFQLLRRFAYAYGLPPHAWLLQHRAEQARRLIQAGEDLAQTAVACGFSDQSHMTRMFARSFGFTPGAWRDAQIRRG